MRSRVSWQEKLNKVQEWKIVDGQKRGYRTMLIPTPRQIDEIIKEIPSGAVSTPQLLRSTLAKRHGADTTCPLCAGIFLRIAAEAADEQRSEGKSDITPYWRVVDKKGRHFPKLPGGRDSQAALLAAEIQI
jgi:hypothetical protein